MFCKLIKIFSDDIGSEFILSFAEFKSFSFVFDHGSGFAEHYEEDVVAVTGNGGRSNLSGVHGVLHSVVYKIFSVSVKSSFYSISVAFGSFDTDEEVSVNRHKGHVEEEFFDVSGVYACKHCEFFKSTGVTCGKAFSVNLYNFIMKSGEVNGLVGGFAAVTCSGEDAKCKEDCDEKYVFSVFHCVFYLSFGFQSVRRCFKKYVPRKIVNYL